MMILTMPGKVVPNIFFWAVVTGMYIVSSWSWPLGDWPFLSSTPITVNGTFFILTTCPIGYMPPKRLVTTVWPRRQALEALLTSSSAKGLPSESGQSLTSSIAGVVPVTPVDQFWLPYITWATPPRTGATYRTAGHSLCIASASLVESVIWLPAPILAPPDVVVPGTTLRTL